jgi:hypothetical protein
MKKDWFRDVKAVREKRVLVVDGDAMFNRPGPRLVDALEWLVSILHSNGTTSTSGVSTDRHTLLARAEALRPVGFPFLDYFQNKESTVEASSGSAGAYTSVKVDTEPEVDDIEEAHRRACDRGESTYIDPATGYTVFTAVAHRKRGKCCGNK